MSDFPRLLREAREAKGVSQTRFASLAGYDHSYLSRLEDDKRQPTRDAVVNLAAALNLSTLERARLLFAAGFSPWDEAPTLRQVEQMTCVMEAAS